MQSTNFSSVTCLGGTSKPLQTLQVDCLPTTWYVCTVAFFHSAMPALSARQLHFCICTSVARDLCSLTSILQLPRLLVHPSCTQYTEHWLDSAAPGLLGLMLAQAENVLVMGTAATYSKELATCLKDANQEQALHQLRNACQKILTIVKSVTSTQASKDRNFWPALDRLLVVLRETLRSIPDGDALLPEIFDPLKPESSHGFEGSVKFVSGAREAFSLTSGRWLSLMLKPLKRHWQECTFESA